MLQIRDSIDNIETCSHYDQIAEWLAPLCRLSFAIAGDAPLLLSNMAASVDTMAEQLTTLNDEKDSWKRQMSKAISLPGLSGGLEGIAEEVLYLK